MFIYAQQKYICIAKIYMQSKNVPNFAFGFNHTFSRCNQACKDLPSKSLIIQCQRALVLTVLTQVLRVLTLRMVILALVLTILALVVTLLALVLLVYYY